MNAVGSRPRSAMRVLSPRIEPPDTELDGIDGEHGHPMARVDDVEAEGLDEGGLAGAGNAGDADAATLAGVGEEGFDEERSASAR